MATKFSNTRLANAADDEPIFVLRATDPLASETIRHWAAHALYRGVSPAKVQAALDLADEMRDWPTKKLPD